MQVSVLGIDLGKNVCSAVGLDASGAVVLRRRIKTETLIGFATKLPRCIVAMEACCGAHHLGRLFANQGHDVRLMSPEYVTTVCEGAKERRSRCGGHRRSGDTSDHAVCRVEEPRTNSTCKRSTDRETAWSANERL